MQGLSGEVRRVADAILERIIDGTYPPGLRIPAESDVAGEFGCGRSTVREALRHLAGMGVIKSRKGSGVVVLDYKLEGCSLALLIPWLKTGDFDHPLGTIARELLRMRTNFVCDGARLAALYAHPGSLTHCRDLIEDSRALEDDPYAHALNDVELHRALHAASDMPPAVWVSNAHHRHFAELSRTFPAVAMVPKNYADKMHQLLDKIEKNDSDGAVEFLREHLRQVDEVVLDLLEQGEQRS